MKCFSLCLMAVIVVLPSVLSEESEILVVLKHTENSFNKKYVDKLFTPRKPVNRTTSITATDIHFKPGVVLESPLYVHIESFRKFATQYKPVMIKYTFEVCDILKYRKNPLFKFFFHKTNETENNLLDPCPMKGRRFQNPYYTSYEHLPPLIPTGIWRYQIRITKGLDEEVFTIISYYEITAKGIIEF